MIQIDGRNFGAALNDTEDYAAANRSVTVGSANCAILAWSHTSITCSVGEGTVDVRAGGCVAASTGK